MCENTSEPEGRELKGYEGATGEVDPEWRSRIPVMKWVFTPVRDFDNAKSHYIWSWDPVEENC